MQVRVADPTFLGYFIDKGVSSAAKVVRKVKSNISRGRKNKFSWFIT
jgi:UDP-N-acetylglucosamine pyrophosphorylase